MIECCKRVNRSYSIYCIKMGHSDSNYLKESDHHYHFYLLTRLLAGSRQRRWAHPPDRWSNVRRIGQLFKLRGAAARRAPNARSGQSAVPTLRHIKEIRHGRGSFDHTQHCRSARWAHLDRAKSRRRHHFQVHRPGARPGYTLSGRSRPAPRTSSARKAGHCAGHPG